MTVLLTSGTVGSVPDLFNDSNIGDEVTVTLHDENGMPIVETGKIAEILEY